MRRCVQDRLQCAKNSVRLSHTLNERQGKAQGPDGTEANLRSEAPEDLRRRIFQEIRDLDKKIDLSGEEIGLMEKKQILEEMLKERRSAEVEEGRDTVIARSGVTRKAVALSRSSKPEGDLHLASVGIGRRGTDDTVVGHGVTRMAVAGSQSSEAEGNLSSFDGRVRRKGTHDTVAVWR